MKGKRKGTPGELDHLFARHVIPEDDYGDFWSRWWKGNASARRSLIREYSEDQDIEIGKEKQGKFEPTKNRNQAEFQAATFGGKVVRRNRLGQFSKTGRHYQAIKKWRKIK